MVPPGPEAWKRLRAPGTYICNIDLIFVLFLLLSSFSLELSGPKVVLLCKLSLYRAVLAPIVGWVRFYVTLDLKMCRVGRKTLLNQPTAKHDPSLSGDNVGRHFDVIDSGPLCNRSTLTCWMWFCRPTCRATLSGRVSGVPIMSANMVNNDGSCVSVWWWGG